MRVLVLLLSAIFQAASSAACATSRISCTNKTSYTYCFDLGDDIMYLSFMNFQCENGLVCSDQTYFPCVPESEVPPTSSSSALTTNTSPAISSTTEGSTLTYTNDTTLVNETNTTYNVSSTFISDHTSSFSPSVTVPSTVSVETSVGSTTQSIHSTTPNITHTTTPAPPVCPNPRPAPNPGSCNEVGKRYPGSVCTKYYECMPFWFGYKLQENICDKGLAYSASQGKCVAPPAGCVCAK